MRFTLYSVVIWGLYAVALFSPVGTYKMLGWEALINGWGGAGIVPWLANVALLLGWVGLRSKTSGAVWLGVAAVALASTAPYFYEVEVEDLRAGYFLWVCSCAALTLSAIFEETRNKPPPREGD